VSDRSTPQPLLGPDDPDPVEIVNADSDSPILLVCDHAGQAIPKALGDLGLPPGAIDLHIGWDIGAERLARGLAARLGAPLILQRYSRLVVDCNRPFHAESFIPEISDAVDVPANRALTDAARRARRDAVFAPLNEAIEAAFAASPRKAAFSIHSFTPVLAGRERPWVAGFLSRAAAGVAELLMRLVKAQAPEAALAVNEPYRIEDETDWFIPAHAEPRGVRHALIEIRNDGLRDEAGVQLWVDLLATALPRTLTASP
jgi:predicted N-formylglutamate amidohydrolase